MIPNDQGILIVQINEVPSTSNEPSKRILQNLQATIYKIYKMYTTRLMYSERLNQQKIRSNDKGY